MKTTLRIGALALACIAGSGLAHADMSAKSTQSYSKTVKYDPAVVQTSEGAQVLYSKLQAAARQVCGAGAYIRLHDRQAVAQCAADAVGRAVQDVNSPTLDAIHDHVRGSVEVIASR